MRARSLNVMILQKINRKQDENDYAKMIKFRYKRKEPNDEKCVNKDNNTSNKKNVVNESAAAHNSQKENVNHELEGCIQSVVVSAQKNILII